MYLKPHQSTHNDATVQTTIEKFTKISSILCLTLTLGLTGCQTFKGFNSDKEDVVESADDTAQGYYQNALEAIADENFNFAESNLKDLRIFYPTDVHAKQALLDIMYAQFMQNKYEDAVASAELFVSLYPNHKQADYAYYVQGVANMAIPVGSFNVFKKNQAERDTSHYRLAHKSFSQLLKKYPTSTYAPDSAKRSVYLYNQFAEHQIDIAQWYVKREAYVASANRAKVVFQNFPRSESIPESIAILAHSYDKLGLERLANDYKTLLTINYPEKIASDGSVILEKKASMPSVVGKLNPFKNKAELNKANTANTTNTTGTQTQKIESLESYRKSLSNQ